MEFNVPFWFQVIQTNANFLKQIELSFLKSFLEINCISNFSNSKNISNSCNLNFTRNLQVTVICLSIIYFFSILKNSKLKIN